MHRYLRMAMKHLQAHEFDPKMDYQLASVIVRGGAVLSVGFNKTTTNSFVEHFASVAQGPDRDFCFSTHAEMDAVLLARGKIDLRGATIYVVRRKRKESLYGMARPCEICQHVLHAYGIRRAFYSIDDTTYAVMKIVNPAVADNNKARDQIITVSGSVSEE